MCRGSAEHACILTPVLSVISRWAHQYAAAATPIPNKQPEKADRSIDAVLSGDLIFQDSLMARKRSNEIFWYQIGLLSWLIRVWGRRCVKAGLFSWLVWVCFFFSSPGGQTQSKLSIWKFKNPHNKTEIKRDFIETATFTKQETEAKQIQSWLGICL